MNRQWEWMKGKVKEDGRQLSDIEKKGKHALYVFPGRLRNSKIATSNGYLRKRWRNKCWVWSESRISEQTQQTSLQDPMFCILSSRKSSLDSTKRSSYLFLHIPKTVYLILLAQVISGWYYQTLHHFSCIRNAGR